MSGGDGEMEKYMTIEISSVKQQQKQSKLAKINISSPQSELN